MALNTAGGSTSKSSAMSISPRKAPDRRRRRTAFDAGRISARTSSRAIPTKDRPLRASRRTAAKLLRNSRTPIRRIVPLSPSAPDIAIPFGHKTGLQGRIDVRRLQARPARPGRVKGRTMLARREAKICNEISPWSSERQPFPPAGMAEVGPHQARRCRCAGIKKPPCGGLRRVRTGCARLLRPVTGFAEITDVRASINPIALRCRRERRADGRLQEPLSSTLRRPTAFPR